MPSHDCPQRHGPVVPFVFIQPPHTGTGTIKGQLLADIPEFCRKQTGTATEQVILDMGIVPRKKGYAPKPPSRHTSFLLLQKVWLCRANIYLLLQPIFLASSHTPSEVVCPAACMVAHIRCIFAHVIPDPPSLGLSQNQV